MKQQIETLKQLYELLDETYNAFKRGAVGIEMLMAICQDIDKHQKLLNKIINERNKRNGIISEIPE